MQGSTITLPDVNNLPRCRYFLPGSTMFPLAERHINKIAQTDRKDARTSEKIEQRRFLTL